MTVYTDQQVQCLLIHLARKLSLALRDLNTACRVAGLPTPEPPNHLKWHERRQLMCVLRMGLDRYPQAIKMSISFSSVAMYTVKLPDSGVWESPSSELHIMRSLKGMASELHRFPKMLDALVWFMEQALEWLETRYESVLRHMEHVNSQRMRSGRHDPMIRALEDAMDAVELELSDPTTHSAVEVF